MKGGEEAVESIAGAYWEKATVAGKSVAAAWARGRLRRRIWRRNTLTSPRTLRVRTLARGGR